LICQQTVAIIKSSNTKRHYETKHKLFSEKYQVGSSLRKSKIECLSLSYSTSTVIINNAMSKQEKCTKASMHVFWILAKHMKPFTDADIVKECVIEVANTLFDDKKDHLNDLMKIICTNLTPNIKKLVKTKKCNFSH